MKELEKIIKEIEEEILKLNTESRGSFSKGTSITGLRKAQDIISKHIKDKNPLIEYIKKEKNLDILFKDSYKGKYIREALSYILKNNFNKMQYIAEKTLEYYYINAINPLQGEVYYKGIVIQDNNLLVLKRDLNKSPKYKKSNLQRKF